MVIIVTDILDAVHHPILKTHQRLKMEAVPAFETLWVFNMG